MPPFKIILIRKASPSPWGKRGDVNSESATGGKRRKQSVKALLGVLVSQPMVLLHSVSTPIHLHPPPAPSRVIHSGPECLPLFPWIGKHHTPSAEKTRRDLHFWGLVFRFFNSLAIPISSLQLRFVLKPDFSGPGSIPIT